MEPFYLWFTKPARTFPGLTSACFWLLLLLGVLAFAHWAVPLVTSSTKSLF